MILIVFKTCKFDLKFGMYIQIIKIFLIIYYITKILHFKISFIYLKYNTIQYFIASDYNLKFSLFTIY